MVCFSFLVEGKSVLNILVSILFPFPCLLINDAPEFQSLLSYVSCLQLYTKTCERSTFAGQSVCGINFPCNLVQQIDLYLHPIIYLLLLLWFFHRTFGLFSPWRPYVPPWQNFYQHSESLF